MDGYYMSDEEHFEVMERVCRCGEPAAIFPGERCEACWNLAGQPLPRFHDERESDDAGDEREGDCIRRAGDGE